MKKLTSLGADLWGMDWVASHHPFGGPKNNN